LNNNKENNMQQTMPLGESFRFTALGLSQVYTAESVGEDMRVPIRWVDVDGVSHSTDYGVEVARKHIESGAWEILPTVESASNVQTEEEAYCAAFSALDGVIRGAKEDGSLLDTIKAFTASGKYNVAIYKGGYTVYCPNDEYRVTSDEQLVEVMKALETLEGCL
jgi:hypothetical protein